MRFRRIVRVLYPMVPQLRALETAEALGQLGWIESQKQNMALNADSEPIPWWTYPAISFIESRLQPDFHVFEYGSGGSTLWLAQRVAQIVSIEHDTYWLERLTAPANAELLLRRGENYPKAIGGRGPFHVVVVDGLDRVACIRAALDELADDGILILDNSERREYEEGCDTLSQAGFRRVDFRGFGPVNSYTWSTTVFYRDGNCLAI